MQQFTFEASPSRIVFGVGSLDRLPEEAERLSVTRALVLCSPGRRPMADQAAARLGGRCAGVCDAGAVNVPSTALEAAIAAVRTHAADGLIVVGGGSTNGLGKSVAAETGLCQIAVPTTYGGSELRDDWRIEYPDSVKRGSGPRARAAVIIYDPLLTIDLPATFSATTGMNAACHAVESMYSPDPDPIALLTGEEGLRALAASLPRVVRDPADIDAREEALYGAFLAGGFRAGSGMEHRMAQTIRTRFGTEHAATHAVMLPYVAAYNRDAAPDAMARTARALGVEDAPTGLYDLNVTLGIRTGLKDLGMREADLDAAADILAEASFHSPRPAGRDDLRAILEAAWHGERPAG